MDRTPGSKPWDPLGRTEASGHVVITDRVFTQQMFCGTSLIGSTSRATGSVLENRLIKRHVRRTCVPRTFSHVNVGLSYTTSKRTKQREVESQQAGSHLRRVKGKTVADANSPSSQKPFSQASIVSQSALFISCSFGFEHFALICRSWYVQITGQYIDCTSCGAFCRIPMIQTVTTVEKRTENRKWASLILNGLVFKQRDVALHPM